MAEPPNRRSIVDEVFATGRYELVTKAGNGCFTEEVAFRLAQREPGQWFHLKKSGGQNQWNGHAVDAVLHESGYAVDIIAFSESTDARPAWSVDKKEDGSPRYADRPDLRIVPTTGCQGTGQPEPPPDNGHPDEIDELKARVGALEATASSQSVLIREQIAVLASLRERVQALEDAPAPEWPPLVAEGRIGRSWGHAHPITITVRKA